MTGSIINSISQVTLQLRGADVETIYLAAQREVLEWLNSRAGRRLPSEAWAGRSFELFREVGYQPVAAAELMSPRYWACRLDDADKHVPKRTWTTEVGLRLSPEGGVIFGCRLLCVTMGDNPPFTPSIPGFVRQVVEKFEAYIDSRHVRSSAIVVNDTITMEKLIKLLLDKNRRHPIIAISRGTKENPNIPPLLDPNQLAKKLIGTAHIVALEPEATYWLTDEIGRDFTVFNQGIRTYYPRFDPNNDQPAQHPVASPATIESWDGIGPNGFETFLINQTLRYSTRREVVGDIPPYSKIHELSLKEKRESAKQQGASDHELLNLALDELENFKKKQIDDVGTYEGLVREAEADRDQAMEELEQQAAEASGLRARVAYLQTALESRGNAEEIPIPVSFDVLEKWCRNYLPGNIVILPRALRAAKKAEFQEPALAFKALLLLKNQYVALRTQGGSEALKAWQDGLHELGLEERPTFSSSRAGEEGEEYKVPWGKRKRLLDRHLKGNTSREERYCFRLYFFWDDESKQVVVGSFPAHLSTRIS